MKQVVTGAKEQRRVHQFLWIGWIFSPADAATLHKAGKAAKAETQISDKTAERSDINRDILTLSWEHLQAARRSADV